MIRYYEDNPSDKGRWVSLEYAFTRCSWEYGAFKDKTFTEFKEAVRMAKIEAFMEGGVNANVYVNCDNICSSW